VTLPDLDSGDAAVGTTERVWLEHISIRDFRNLEHVDVDLPGEGIAIIGDNGHGKTNRT
jgi:ABC-type Mn2+/Zn2+ transport system ATPase subunit